MNNGERPKQTYIQLKQQLSSYELKLLQNFDKISIKLLRVQRHLEFLTECKISKVIPNFITRNGRILNADKRIQTQILHKHILYHKNQIKELTKRKSKLNTDFRNIIWNKNHIEIYNEWNWHFIIYLNQLDRIHQNVHLKKLRNLGVNISQSPRKLVYNLSKITITTKETRILENGPNFQLKPKPNELFDKIELEHLYDKLIKNSPVTISNEIMLNLKQNLREECLIYNRNVRKKQVFINSEIKSLYDLLKKEEILLLKSDKGNSLVLVDK